MGNCFSSPVKTGDERPQDESLIPRSIPVQATATSVNLPSKSGSSVANKEVTSSTESAINNAETSALDENMTSQAGEPVTGTTAIRPAPSLTICRFEDENLITQVKDLGATEFLAISHVWGDASWMKVAGIDHEILVSREKAKFIAGQLRSIVGEQWFWMDVLCLDQRDSVARVAITQQIPTIFRLAQKTIAVRDSTGFKECCVEAAGHSMYFFSKSREWRSTKDDDSDIDFSDEPDGRRKLIQHVSEEHAGDVMDEGLLTRLWPLQEVILSDTIQFVRCEPVEGDVPSRTASSNDARTLPVLGASLSALAITWSTHGEDNDNSMRFRIGFTKNELISAFLKLGTASRPNKNREVLLPNERDIMMQINSTRETTKPRDFILAIMPQYGFYKIPEGAKQLTFTELFLDCCKQLRESGIALGPVFLESDHILDGRIGSLRVEVPPPQCLGDLAKLLNGPVMRSPPGTQIELQPVEGIPMTKVMDKVDQLLPGMEDITEEETRIANAILVIHTIVRSIFNSTVLWGICHHELNRELATLAPEAREKRAALQAFHHILSRIDFEKDSYENAVMMTETEIILLLLASAPWEVSIMYASMISCGLGISGFDWAMENLSPLQINIERVSYLALAPDSVVMLEGTAYYLKSGGYFQAGRDGPLPRQALLSGNPATQGYFSLCMFPPDTKFKGVRHY